MENFRRNLAHELAKPGARDAISARTEIHPRRLTRLERGGRGAERGPTLDDVAALALALQVDPGDLAFGRLDLPSSLDPEPTP